MSYHNTYRLLFMLSGANFQSTSDQTMIKIGIHNNYRIKDIIAKQASGGATIAVVGGIYTAASKGGTALVSAAQSWIGLTGAGKIVIPTLAGVIDTDIQSATPILSLTTGSTGAVTADVYIFGLPID